MVPFWLTPFNSWMAITTSLPEKRKNKGNPEVPTPNIVSLDFHGADLTNAYKPNSNKLISPTMLVAWASKAAGEESVTTGEPFVGGGRYSISFRGLIGLVDGC